MPRPFGSRNRTKIPQASEMVKYGAQTLKDGLEFLDEIVNSNDKSVTIKNKMDAIKQIKEILDMAGYGKELEAGTRKIVAKEGEINPYREQGEIIPQPSRSEGKETTPETKEDVKETPNIDSILGRFEG